MSEALPRGRKMGWMPGTAWGVSQSSCQSPTLGTPTGEAQPGQLEKGEGGAATPSTAPVCTGASPGTALCPWGFVAGSVYCLYCM